ncbi:hypothetical protein EBR21_14685, partial [bacterium]|nr:hypothetical protein [bacterium]
MTAKGKGKGKFRVTTRGARNNDRDAQIILLTLLLVGLLGLTAFFSLGSRSTEATNPFYAWLNSSRNKARGWENPAMAVHNVNTPDTRSHAGFHFRWGQKFNSPAWQIETPIKGGRKDDVQKILKLGKSKINLSQRGDSEYFFDANEELLKGGNAIVQKKVLPLLPGEKLTFSYPSGGFVGK